MPTYNFKNKETGEEYSKFLFTSELEGYLKDNPLIIQTISAGSQVGDPWRMGRIKPDDGFRDILRNIKKKHAHTTVNTF